ncbi:MAG: SufE family protein [Woeseiaceae bacterium]|nr:SufE family protein [Woeseiaceae bacterium]
MNEVTAEQEAVVEEFAMFDDWMDRYQYLIDLGRRLPELDPEERVDDNLVRGCQSQVWFIAEKAGDRLRFRANSDAAIVSGLIALLLRIYSDRKPEDILESRPEFVDRLELRKHLSSTRSSGLASMLEAINQFAEDARH